MRFWKVMYQVSVAETVSCVFETELDNMNIKYKQIFNGHIRGLRFVIYEIDITSNTSLVRKFVDKSISRLHAYSIVTDHVK